MGEKVLRTYVADPKRDIQTLECYRMNKIFMQMIGQWPFSPIWQQRLGISIFLCGIGNLYVLEIIHMINSRKSINQILDCFAPVMVNTASFIKLGTLLFGAEAVRELFTRMQEDWNTKSTEAEKRILQEYANNSQFLTFVYMVYMYFTMFAYLLMPTVPMALNVIQPLNESRPKELPSHAEYFIDEPTEHYLPLFLHQSLGTFGSVTTVIICDTMYVTYVQHACGIFAILNYQLEHLVDGEEYEEDLFAPKENNRIFAKVVQCIEQHQKAIKFAEFIENMYYISNLMQMMINMLVISVTGVQTATNLDQMEMVMRFGSFTVAELIHLLYNSLPGQAIHDHSSSVFHSALWSTALLDHSIEYLQKIKVISVCDTIPITEIQPSLRTCIHDRGYANLGTKYTCNWYSISKNSRDLLKLIMLRSKTPCQLTAGKLYVMDLERFSAVVQTSMSYFTVLTSMR